LKQIGTGDIADNAVTTPKIADNSITTPKIADDAVTAEKIKQQLVHVLWHDDIPGNFDIIYKRDGADFDPTIVNLSDNAASSFNPAVAVSGSNVHVVWQDDDIFYKRSTDGGATFGPVLNLSDNPNLSHHPAIAVFGNNVYVVWHDETPGNFDILYKRSTDGGANFEPTQNLSNNAGGSFGAAIAVSGNIVHVVWKDNTPGNFDVLYRRSASTIQAPLSKKWLHLHHHQHPS
jgi:hypothetical protein